jgi:hypothetical protein
MPFCTFIQAEICFSRKATAEVYMEEVENQRRESYQRQLLEAELQGRKVTADDHAEEVENQHRENFQRQLLEAELQGFLEAKERQKNKRQQRKDMKEKVCYQVYTNKCSSIQQYFTEQLSIS